MINKKQNRALMFKGKNVIYAYISVIALNPPPKKIMAFGGAKPHLLRLSQPFEITKVNKSRLKKHTSTLCHRCSHVLRQLHSHAVKTHMAIMAVITC